MNAAVSSVVVDLRWSSRLSVLCSPIFAVQLFEEEWDRSNVTEWSRLRAEPRLLAQRQTRYPNFSFSVSFGFPEPLPEPLEPTVAAVVARVPTLAGGFGLLVKMTFVGPFAGGSGPSDEVGDLRRGTHGGGS